ncbi:MAG: ParA family protein [Betaproteobacteria bacterium]|nr:ParA family protein [Betaproteobacteria bacterium]
MQTILVANPKGGSGKTTLATNVAGWLAGKRQRVLLSDLDPQRSSAEWLARRPRGFPPIAAGSSEPVPVGAEPAADRPGGDARRRAHPQRGGTRRLSRRQANRSRSCVTRRSTCTARATARRSSTCRGRGPSPTGNSGGR